MLLFYFSLFTAPVALYYVIRYWKQPQGVLPRTRVRFVLAAVIAVAQLLGWVVLAVTLVNAYTSQGRLD